MGEGARKLKALITKRSSLLRKYSKARKKGFVSGGQITKMQSDIAAVELELEKHGKNHIIISEHALLRYLEYQYKLDVEAFENEILNDQTEILMKGMGDGKYAINEDLMAVLRSGVVVSIVPNK